MNAKGFCILLCSIVVFWSIPIFADCSSPERQYIEKQVDIRNEILTFNTIVQKHEIGYRCYPGLSISIKESRAGLLRDGDVIYFKTGTGKNDDKYLEVMGIDITTKGVTAKEQEIPAITSYRASPSETEPPGELIYMVISFSGSACCR